MAHRNVLLGAALQTQEAGLSVWNPSPCTHPAPAQEQPGSAAGRGGGKGSPARSLPRCPFVPSCHLGTYLQGQEAPSEKDTREEGRRRAYYARRPGKGWCGNSSPCSCWGPTETLMRACGAVSSHCPGQTGKDQELSIATIHLWGQQSAYPLAFEESRTEILCNSYGNTAPASLGCL